LFKETERSAQQSSCGIQEIVTRATGIAALILLLTGGAALAADNCVQQLDDIGKEWGAISFRSPEKPNAPIVYGQGGHRHTGAQVTYMADQIHLAAHLCKDGKEHDAMLRMDVVRAWLKRPEVQHPPEHAYTPAGKS